MNIHTPLIRPLLLLAVILPLFGQTLKAQGAPSALRYSSNPATYIKDTLIPDNTPTSGGGAVTSYAVSPALPAGLTLNTSTGVISGTPTTLAASADYTVTATNTDGSTTAALKLAVVQAPEDQVEITGWTAEVGNKKLTEAVGGGFSAVNPSGVTRAAAMSEPFSSRYTTLPAGGSAVISKNHSAVATHRWPSTKPSAAPTDCNYSLSEKSAEKRL